MCGLGYAGLVCVRLSLGRRREPRAALCRDLSQCDASRQSVGRSNCLSKLLLRCRNGKPRLPPDASATAALLLVSPM